MAGRGQHYIPRFLQRGFICNNQEQVYFYSKIKNEVIKVNISKVGVGRDFYSVPEDTYLDDVITENENRIIYPLIDVLRSLESDDIIDKNTAITLISHFITRTKYIRDLCSEVFKSTLDILESQIATKKAEEEFIKNLVESNMFKEDLKKEFKQQKLIPDDLFINSLCAQMVKNPNEFPILNQAIKAMKTVYQKLQNDHHEMVKKSHKKALTNLLESSDTKYDQYENFIWHLKIYPDDSIILSDNIAMTYNTETKQVYPPFFTNKDNNTQIYMPISHNKLLVGTQNNSPILEIDQINEYMISISSNFFIASIFNEEHKHQIQLIGNNLREQIQQGILEASKNMFN